MESDVNMPMETINIYLKEKEYPKWVLIKEDVKAEIRALVAKRVSTKKE